MFCSMSHKLKNFPEEHKEQWFKFYNAACIRIPKGFYCILMTHFAAEEEMPADVH